MKYVFPFFLLFNTIVYGQPNHLVISQVYGGGGNSGAVYANDYIVVFNPGSLAIDLTGFSLHYATAAGTTWNHVVSLTGTIQAKKYILIQLAGGVNGIALPTADFSASNNLSASSGKIGLILSPSTLSASCPASFQFIDFIGYGTANCSETQPAVQGNNAVALTRKAGGCMDTDNNAVDFTAMAPSPKNSASPEGDCSILLSNLPICFLNEKINYQNGKLEIFWTNESESEVLAYIIEGSENGIDFKTLQKILPLKNNGSRSDYVTGINPDAALKYIRIKGIEWNEEATYSKVIPVRHNYLDIQLYPNPAREEIIIRTSKMDKTANMLSIYNAFGKKTDDIKIIQTGGPVSLKISLRNYCPGQYFICINGEFKGRFIKL